MGLREGTTQQTFFREGFVLMSNPLPFSVPFFIENVPFSTPSVEKAPLSPVSPFGSEIRENMIVKGLNKLQKPWTKILLVVNV